GVFSLMLLISTGIGLFHGLAKGGQQTTEDFFTGGRRMSALPVGLSLSASFMSAIQVLGVPAESYRYGAKFLWMCFGQLLNTFLTSHLSLPLCPARGTRGARGALPCRWDGCSSRQSSECLSQPWVPIETSGCSAQPWVSAESSGYPFHSWVPMKISGCLSRPLGVQLSPGCPLRPFDAHLSPGCPLRLVGAQLSPGCPSTLGLSCATCPCPSTASTSINAMAAVTLEDLLKPRLPSLAPRRLALISKGLSLLYGTSCITVAALASLLGGGVLQ
ncbi:Sodium/iodide cotransporter, partial [Dryobates pubescens]